MRSIRKALTKTIESSKSTATKRNQIKKAKKKQKEKDNVGPENIVAGKRKRNKKKGDLPTFKYQYPLNCIHAGI